LKQLAPGVSQLRGFPPDAINVYLVEDVLIDAGTRRAGKRILSQVSGRDVRALALTHVHADHQGAADEVCGKLGIEYWVGEREVPQAEDPRLLSTFVAPHPLNRIALRTWVGPGRRVDRALREGDEVAGFQVLDAPGHSPGHIAYWRESDRVLILGDVLNSIHVLTGLRGLHEAPSFFTYDREESRRSARRLAALEPSLVLFGHGPRDARKLTEFVAALPG
jgi:glyoxylase-like metal-dependent hydrolase (beta-lactamase superfamily II)